MFNSLAWRGGYVAIIQIFGKQRLGDHHNFMASLASLGSHQANMGYWVRLSQNKNKSINLQQQAEQQFMNI